MTDKSKKPSRRVAKLHASCPLCHWCGEKTILMTGIHTKFTVPLRATLDHLDDRLNRQRGKSPGTVRTVLACWACNNTRAAARNIECRDQQRKRSEQGRIWK